MVSTIQDYPIEGVTVDGVPVAYRTRTWCLRRNGAMECGGLGIFGPTIDLRAGNRVRIVVHNEFDVEEARELGPPPPTVEDWYPLADNVTGRYAGLQSCGFEFTGLRPSNPNGFIRDHTNMPGHRDTHFEGTNLHLHGLEIVPHLFEPLGTSNPSAEMINIVPGGCGCYDLRLPQEHPAGGTYWYHPHWHSSAAIQAWSGMAGVVRVFGDLDALLTAHGVTQDLPFAIWDPHFRVLEQEDKEDGAAGGNASSEVLARRLLLGPRRPIGTDLFLMAQTDQSEVRYLVNAMYQPEIRMRPGETVRLRVLCATTENLAGFEILDQQDRVVPFWIVASDGILYDAPVQQKRLILAGGQREELLLQLREAGTYRVVSRGISKVQFFCTGPEDAMLATIQVDGDPLPGPLLDVAALPLQSPKKPIQPEEIVETRYVVLSMKADRSRVPFPQFLQNGKPYNESEIEFRIKANTAEEWIVMNPDRTMHPMHLHVSPFQVKDMVSAYMPEEPAMKHVTTLDPSLANWRDTVIVPPQGSVKLWVRWGDFKGKTVAHCHFLAHEDTGMIMNILLE